MKQLLNEVPDNPWSLLRSKNRPIYIEALLQINEEYQYSNYFLSREICIQTLSDCFSKQKILLEQSEMEGDFDLLEPVVTRILNWLLQAGWLRKVDDYYSVTVNIVIPDYVAVFVDVSTQLCSDEEDAVQVYIQNIYVISFSFKNSTRANLSSLKTAPVNTRKLNKTLQDMLHNMNKFPASLLEKGFYGDLLKEHLNGYVEETVRRKHHILKTSDNFYLCETDIKMWLNEMRQDPEWLSGVCERNRRMQGRSVEVRSVLEQINLIERGFDDIEHRIVNMDKEHSKYVRATVTRLDYPLNEEDNMKGLMIQLLDHLSLSDRQDEEIGEIGGTMNLSQFTTLSDKSLYRPRRPWQDFTEHLSADEEPEELSKDEILKLNRIRSRYSRKQIEEFVFSHMTDGRVEVTSGTASSDEDFEKLVLAYDYSTRKGSPYRVREQEMKAIDNGRYRYPKLALEEKRKNG